MMMFCLPFFSLLMSSSLSWLASFAMIPLSLILILVKSYSEISANVASSTFYLDSASSLLLTLTIWISMLMICASLKLKLSTSFDYFMLLVLILNIALVIAFLTKDLMVFYILFEVSLIPTFLIILGWGYQPERLQAGVYMMIYTVCASLPLLLALLYWTNLSCSASMTSLYPLSGSSSMRWFVGASMSLAFMVKLPVYMVHLWLPKAHVEAPVAGSMILAAVLLKLGGYGLYRLWPLMPMFLSMNAFWLMGWASLGGVIMGFVCLSQTDIKSLIAVSSVCHMALVIMGLVSQSGWGLQGTFLVMISHGFCSSALFCAANMNYERSTSRSLKLMKGLYFVLPSLALSWFILLAVNMSAPPSINLMAEIFIFISTLAWDPKTVLALLMINFLPAAYGLYIYSSLNMEDPSHKLFSSKPMTAREQLTMALHATPLILTVVYLSVMTLS